MVATITIDNRVRVTTAELEPEVVSEIKAAFEHSNPDFFRREKIGISTWGVGRKIRMWEKTPTQIEVPRGGLARVIAILEGHGVDRHFIDARTEGVALVKRIPDHRVALWSHQARLVDVAIAVQQCILRAPTGSGKTSLAFAIAARLKLPTLVIVSTRALFDQWVRRAQVELGLKKKDIGVIQAKRRNLKPLTIAMQKTLAVQGVDAELAEFFGVVLCDEVQLFAAKTFIEAVDPFKSKYRIGISADHRRKDRKEFLVHDLFGAVAAEVSRSDLIDSGIIVDTEVRVVPTDFEASWYGVPETDVPEGDVLEPKFWENVFPKRSDPPPPFEEPKEIDWDRLLSEMTLSEERNAKILWAVDQGRLHSKQVIVMSHRREHCRHLDLLIARSNIQTGFLIGGEDYKSQFVQTREAFEKGQIEVAVGTFQAIGYGIDLPKAEVVVCATPIASNKQLFAQVRGRVCRSAKGKSESWMYYLWDRRLYGLGHIRNLVRWNRGRVVIWDNTQWIEAKQFLTTVRQQAGAI